MYFDPGQGILTNVLYVLCVIEVYLSKDDPGRSKKHHIDKQ